MKVLVDLLVLEQKKLLCSSIDLPLIMIIERDLLSLNSRPAQVRAVVHRESIVWTPETVEDIRLR